MMLLIAGLLCLVIANASAAPAEDPVRVDLPVYAAPEEALEETPGAPADAGEDRSDRTLSVGLLGHKLQAAGGLLAGKLGGGAVGGGLGHSYGGIGGGIFSPPVTALEHALLEQEDFGSQKLSIKDNLHGFVAGLFQPKPIVDEIKEEEKFGNSGDKFFTAGRAIVGGAEGVSNLVNSVLEVPGKIFQKIARATTEKLNNLGGKLIGL